MLVLHVLNTRKYSGAENVACQIILSFSDNKSFDFVYSSPDGEIGDSVRDYGISFEGMTSLTVKELKRVIRKVKPDIIHAHDMRAALVASLSTMSIPIITHIHNNSFDNHRISIKTLFFLYPAMRSRNLIWVSNSAFHGYIFSALFIKKSTILYNVIDIDLLMKKMRQDSLSYDYDVVFLGRLTYPKNPERFIELCVDLVAKKPRVKIAIAGTGELKDEVEHLILENDLQNNVIMLGFLNNPLKLLSDSKVMVMTSRWEGTPMVALESFALGVPIVSTPVDGLLDIVKNGITGYTSDNNRNLVDYIEMIISDKAVHQKLSENCAIFSKRYNDINKYNRVINNMYCGKR